MDTALFPDNNSDRGRYLVLARKYRPRFFRDIVGQDVFAKIIQNAIRSSRVAHGFLLIGMRGIGKTTMARLIAKAINCEKLLDIASNTVEEQEIEPCAKCASCLAFEKDRHLDVIEIDAASNTGVDDMRQIIESCSYSPVCGKYKVYIIDEVHMLSKSAFNALLKTLEEPPHHVKFILATTEENKVPNTISSRCLKFHLRRIDVALLEKFIISVCEIEGIKIDSTAAREIAIKSEGSMRDALSILEQAILLSSNNYISDQTLYRMFGGVKSDDIMPLVASIFSKNAAEAISIVRKLYSTGADPRSILSELMTAIHALSVSLVTGSPELGDYIEQAREFGIANLARIWKLATNGPSELSSSLPSIALEMMVMRMAYIGHFPSPEAILKQLAGWEAKPPSTPAATPCARAQPDRSYELSGELSKKASELFGSDAIHAID
ncbi:DNA polymerase III subunit gamma/tau [Candidatus Hydrogenosomobacter endosymbioticus]|uniref:DNA polymerase III subunit gamma/tau n=1 Tax=Candidatus Hydrogenosomobacter endosymbioticus TaxID=2558174 RepID=A0ABN6L3S1_9PROT|nr:DNA polymerase III subunit gamma/tau [Candidatus Hydrogenosomobacter endosymbioticus]BDB96565.1 hypothetical protein HYD_6980 [Candidatus Hydrogenosomobacter endosymbioticus]